MKNTVLIILGLLASFGLGYFLKANFSNKTIETLKKASEFEIYESIDPENMKLGAFSISLSVKNLQTSKSFYEKLGFKAFAGSEEKNYLIMKNENALIGLFQGMFKNNILTFNPGWDELGKNIEAFDDVRVIQQNLKNNGITINPEIDEKSSGPAGFMVTDPDGNVILIDQHR